MELAEIEYHLPQELIAQRPCEQRDASRLLVLHRAPLWLEHRQFRDIVNYVEPGDVIVVNETKVIRARLRGEIDHARMVEVLLIEAMENGMWRCLVKPARRLRAGMTMRFHPSPLVARAIQREQAWWVLQFEPQDGLLMDSLDQIGEVPLPPYIERSPDASDEERYQTVYARVPGAVAAPTAGLHFTEALIHQLQQRGVTVPSVSLHVSYGTFAPIREEDPRCHQIDREWFDVPHGTIEAMNHTRAHGKRVIAVGTTTCRVLETLAQWQAAPYRAQQGWTELFICPPFEFQLTNGLITNFHMPRSSLLLLVGAFVGSGFWREAYEEAIRLKYRFLSYGDAMLIL